MAFWEKAGDVFLQSRAAAAQNKDAMQRINLHGHNLGQQLWLSQVAAGYGIDPATQPYLKPYGVEPDMNVTNNYTPSQPEQEKQSAWPWITGLLLGATGLGVGGGTLYALKDKVGSTIPAITAPVATVPAKPQAFDIKIEQIDGNLKVNQVK